ncbi:MAG: DUF763 domain-containing protein, partial [Flavobacteriales bacterium]|nr:DUF763 domain-containing protein [Flavobacteriales bacterium]
IHVEHITGLDGNALAQSSKLSAKIDNTAVQDGFQLYLHNFLVSDEGEWAIIQQGMNGNSGKARRYHWTSQNLKSFTEDPHAAICGIQEQRIINVVDSRAKEAQKGMIEVSKENPEYLKKELPHLLMPGYCDVKAKDVDMKRLGSLLYVAQENQINQFEDLLLLKGMGPRAMQSLALVAELIHGTPTRFNDPARFSFAHGAKNSKPFPVPTSVYDDTIETMSDIVRRAKLGAPDKAKALEKLHKVVKRSEEGFKESTNPERSFEDYLKKENRDSHLHSGRSVKGWSKPPNNQLNLFDSDN